VPGTFWVANGLLKLKDVDRVVVSTERVQDGTPFVLMALKMRDGKVWEIGGTAVNNLPEKPYPRKELFSFKLPEEKAWRVSKPDELTINLGVVKAKWKKDAKSSTSS
jgi:hypothetical protein